MTRETKIGLLVGLAFIIVIGILLSDHMTSANELPGAPLSSVAPNVRQGVDAPDSHQGTMTVVAPAKQVIPQNPIQTQREVQQQPAGEQIVIAPMGDPARALQKQQEQEPPVQQQPTEPTVATDNTGGNADVDPTVGISQGKVNPDLQKLAQSRGQELVQVAPNGQRPAPPPVVLSNQTGAREYKAEAGDSLSRMAARLFGTNNKANREAIIKLNPSLQQNPDKIVVGQKYLVPATADASAPKKTEAPVSPQPKPAAPAPVAQQKPVQPVNATPSGGNWYTVKENDKLWKIAAEQLGSGNRWKEIQDLNPDVLQGSANVRPGMRLRLPAKAVASSN